MTQVNSHDAASFDSVRSRCSSLRHRLLLTPHSLAGRIAIAVIVGKSRAAHRCCRGARQRIGGAGNGAGSGADCAADESANRTACSRAARGPGPHRTPDLTDMRALAQLPAAAGKPRQSTHILRDRHIALAPHPTCLPPTGRRLQKF
jgi:hypothetical protein